MHHGSREYVRRFGAWILRATGSHETCSASAMPLVILRPSVVHRLLASLFDASATGFAGFDFHVKIYSTYY
jgi:hypothetical protein